MERVTENHTLSVEQRGAFGIVAQHNRVEKLAQLLVYVKSRVVNALCESYSSGARTLFKTCHLYQCCGEEHRGATLYALLQ